MWTAAKGGAGASKKQEKQKQGQAAPKEKEAAPAKAEVKLIDVAGMKTYREYYDDTYMVSGVFL